MSLNNVSRGRVLVVDDEASQRGPLASLIGAWGYEAATAADGQEALEMVASFRPTVIVTDLMMPRVDGAEMLRRLRSSGPVPPTIILTAFGNLETAVEMVHTLGAFWYLEKPMQASAMKLLLERAAAQSRLADQYERLQGELSRRGVLEGLVGESPVMQRVFSLIRQVGPTTATVLITGESGTGKELAARALHSVSPRQDEPFVAVNCAALPESLIESELFGHEKGAFTGAAERRRGCFELANGGTILLDEIGEMPLPTQSKLLRVLEDRKVRRLGASTETAVDVRVIASTNRSLEEEIQRGRFREDLFFRINVFQVALPPLRERKADIPILSDTMIAQLNQRHACRVAGLAPASLDLLMAHDWPGNVRELRNALERAVILTGEGLIQPAHLPQLTPPSTRVAAPAVSLDNVTLPVGTTVSEAERALIYLTLRHTGNNRTRAAAILGVSTKTLFNKLKEYGASSEES
jgi:DNA-binding NtrC family response regulator